MATIRALSQLFELSDKRFFADHPDRVTHIRQCHQHECEAEFQSLGFHESNRRRILLIRIDAEGKMLPDNQVLKIPFLLFQDETVEDRDDVLKPIIEEVMRQEAGPVQ